MNRRQRDAVYNDPLDSKIEGVEVIGDRGSVLHVPGRVLPALNPLWLVDRGRFLMPQKARRGDADRIVRCVEASRRGSGSVGERTCRVEAICDSSAVRKDSAVMLCGGSDRRFPELDA
jgi:hypothetical protein